MTDEPKSGCHGHDSGVAQAFKEAAKVERDDPNEIFVCVTCDKTKASKVFCVCDRMKSSAHLVQVKDLVKFLRDMFVSKEWDCRCNPNYFLQCAALNALETRARAHMFTVFVDTGLYTKLRIAARFEYKPETRALMVNLEMTFWKMNLFVEGVKKVTFYGCNADDMMDAMRTHINPKLFAAFPKHHLEFEMRGCGFLRDDLREKCQINDAPILQKGWIPGTYLHPERNDTFVVRKYDLSIHKVAGIRDRHNMAVIEVVPSQRKVKCHLFYVEDDAQVMERAYSLHPPPLTQAMDAISMLSLPLPAPSGPMLS